MKNLNRTPLDIYLNDISKYPLLTKEDEQKFSSKIIFFSRKIRILEKNLRAKNNAAPEISAKLVILNKKMEFYRKKMIQGNCRLVVSIAKKYRNSSMSLLDIIEEGNIGLIKAVKRFDPTRGFRFSTFAIWWIKQSVIKALKDKSKIIRVPIHIDNEVRQYKKVSDEYVNAHGIEPSLLQLTQLTKMDIKKLRFIINVPNDHVSMDNYLGDSKNNRHNYLSDTEDTLSPIDEMVNQSLTDAIKKVLNQLKYNEQQVIILRFGLFNQTPLTLDAIGETLKITRERVRQIQAMALKKLKSISIEKNLEIYLQ